MKVEFRDLKIQDREALERMLASIRSFDSQDRAIALELIDTALDHADQKDYSFILATDEEDKLVGYTCYGPTPLTDGTFDLYWVVVDPENSDHGIGTLLLQAVEQSVRDHSGRMIIIETSSDEGYGRTRHFYLKNGYTLAETIKDFYRPGEDRLTYLKRF